MLVKKSTSTIDNNYVNDLPYFSFDLDLQPDLIASVVFDQYLDYANNYNCLLKKNFESKYLAIKFFTIWVVIIVLKIHIRILRLIKLKLL